MIGGLRLGAAVVACAATVSSCASVNVDALSQPGNAFRGGYDIVIEFDNVLNLPGHAKVRQNGITVGVVTNVALKRHGVEVTSRIDPAVVVPSNIHAALQQATVLGDVSVVLDSTPGGDRPAAALGPGGRIPLSQTTSPPQLEDTIANLATFVSSGSIQRLQNTIIGLNHVTPTEKGAVTKLASRVAADLSGLSDNMRVDDQLLKSVAATADTLRSRIPQFQHWFSPEGLLGFDRVTEFAAIAIGTAIPRVGLVYSQGFYLVPFLQSLGDALGALQHSKWAFEKEYPAWQGLLTDFLLPQDRYPAINITSIVGPDGREMSGDVMDVLRILGMTP